MALGSGDSKSTDSLFLTITSGVAIAVVFLLVILLVFLRAKHAARTRRDTVRIEEEMEKKFALGILHKPTLHEVWVAKTDLERPPSLRFAPSDVILQDSEKTLGAAHEWDTVMPLSAMVYQDSALQEEKNPCPVSHSIGVFVQLPQPRTSDSNIKETQGIGAASGAGDVQESNIVLGLNQCFVNCRP